MTESTSQETNEPILKVYLAARYSRREEMCRYRDELAKHNIAVTSRWIDGGHELPDMADQFDADEWARFADEDVDDLRNADFAVNFTEHPGAPGRQRGGRHVEFGMMLAASIPFCIVGPRENIFHWLKMEAGNLSKQFDTWEDGVVEELINNGERNVRAKAEHLRLVADAITSLEGVSFVVRVPKANPLDRSEPNA